MAGLTISISDKADFKIKKSEETCNDKVANS